MKRRYDPTAPDPLGIRAAVERERLASRYRDRSSRGRIHPAENDVGRLFDFVASRRLRQPGVMNLLHRIHHSIDTEAIRLLVEMVITKGSCNHYMLSRCQRLIDMCDTVDSALALNERNYLQ